MSPRAAAIRLPPSVDSTSTSSSSKSAWSNTKAHDSWLIARNGSHVGRPRRAERRMGMSGADGVGACGEHRVVDVVAGRVDGSRRVAVEILDLPAGTDQHELIDRRLAERHAPVEQPEVIGEPGVSGRHVPVAELAPPHRGEDAVAERAHPFAVQPFVLDRADGAVGRDPDERRIRRLTHVIDARPRLRQDSRGPVRRKSRRKRGVERPRPAVG